VSGASSHASLRTSAGLEVSEPDSWLNHGNCQDGSGFGHPTQQEAETQAA